MEAIACIPDALQVWLINSCPALIEPSAHPTKRDVFNFNKRAGVFVDVVRHKHASSLWGQQIDCCLLWHITDLAAPYVLHPEQYLAGQERVRGSISDFLLYFEPEHRAYGWWWHQSKREDVLLDLEALEDGPRIFAGGLAMWNYDEESFAGFSSKVMKSGSDGHASWFAMCMDLRGTHTVSFDLMVHADSSMLDILTFVAALFKLPLLPSAEFMLWGFDDDGNVDVESYYSYLAIGVGRHHTSGLLHSRLADVYKIMDQATVALQSVVDQEITDQGHRQELLERQTVLCKRLTLALWQQD